VTLEDYLASEFYEDTQDIRALESALRDAGKTFAVTFDSTTGWWPYEIQRGQEEVHGKTSQGTSAMICAAIGKMIQECSLRDFKRTEPIEGLPRNLKKILLKGTRTLYDNLIREKNVKSGTFGDNDILTISHITDLARGLDDKTYGVRIRKARVALGSAVGRVDKLLNTNPSDWSSLHDQLRTGKEASGEREYVASAFIALRIVRASCDLAAKPSITSNIYRTYFESNLHDQLSFSAIPDSRFDAAELAFCLEGLLLCAPEAVDVRLFDRVLSVMEEKQNSSAHWRATKPFMAGPTGGIMLPLSVEGANSLLRAVEINDGVKLHDTFASRALPIFRRFWQWLRTRRICLSALETTMSGWHSEHIDVEDVIHLWDTSQVVEFMLGFRRLLHRHVALTTLSLSRASVAIPNELEFGNWKRKDKTFEPLEGSTLPLPRVFDLIGRDFIDQWYKGTDIRNYSVLLYGPPGTGKTTVARSISDTLGFPLVTITVSDFLGAGGALVEARAKAVFDMLIAQRNCVILFDEIDAFLLDRDSEYYDRQDTLFKFLTPGMLTKMNDLRSARRSIFIIATNYANRIDPAIKRPGRIDKQYLLLPPAQARRKMIIERFLSDRKPKRTDLQLEALASAALYLGYKEIEGVVKRVAGARQDELARAFKEAPRSTTFEGYLSRLAHEHRFPADEFLAMVRLAEEAGRSGELRSALEKLDSQQKSALARFESESKDMREALNLIRKHGDA
jgi:MoxR-like ATPase